MGFLDWLAEKLFGSPSDESDYGWGCSAKPGRWYGKYNSEWHAAHPGAWERRELEPGGFYAGDIWGSSTFDWDCEWFSRNNMAPPRRMQCVKPNPNAIPICQRLGPGESVSFKLDVKPEG